MTSDSSLYLLLSPNQEAILIAALERENVKKLGVAFNTPADDAEQIRRIAYLDGGRDMLEFLLTLDEKLLQQKEEEKQQLLGNTQPPLF